VEANVSKRCSGHSEYIHAYFYCGAIPQLLTRSSTAPFRAAGVSPSCAKIGSDLGLSPETGDSYSRFKD
jgi:hypothetical protein